MCSFGHLPDEFVVAAAPTVDLLPAKTAAHG